MHSALKLMPDPIPEVPRDGAIGSGTPPSDFGSQTGNSTAFSRVYEQETKQSPNQDKPNAQDAAPKAGNRAEFDHEAVEKEQSGKTEQGQRQHLTAEQLRELAAEKGIKQTNDEPEHITRPMDVVEQGKGKGDINTAVSPLDKLMGLVEGADKLIRQDAKPDDVSDEALKQHKLADAIDAALVGEKSDKASERKSVSEVLRGFTETAAQSDKTANSGQQSKLQVTDTMDEAAVAKITAQLLGKESGVSKDGQTPGVLSPHLNGSDKVLSKAELEALKAQSADGKEKFLAVDGAKTKMTGQTPDTIPKQETGEPDLVLTPIKPSQLDKGDKETITRPMDVKLDPAKGDVKPREIEPHVIKPGAFGSKEQTHDTKPMTVVKDRPMEQPGSADKPISGSTFNGQIDLTGFETKPAKEDVVMSPGLMSSDREAVLKGEAQVNNGTTQQLDEEVALMQKKLRGDAKTTIQSDVLNQASDASNAVKMANENVADQKLATDPLAAPQQQAQQVKPFVAATGKVEKNILGKATQGKSANDNVIAASADKAAQTANTEKQQSLEQQQNFDGEQQSEQGMFDDMFVQQQPKESLATNTKTVGQFANTMNQFSADSASRLNATTQTLNTTGTEKTPPQLTETLNITRPDIAGQMKERMTIMMNRGIQVADIRLDPAELGQMQVRMSVENDVTSVNFVVQNGQAKEMLEQMMPKLKDMLAEQGVEMGESSVSQQDSGAQDTEQASADGQSGGNGTMAGGSEVDAEHDPNIVQEVKIANGALGGIDYFA